MRTIKLVAILALSLSIGVMTLQNTAPVQARFLWMEMETPMILLLALTGGGGFVVGLMVALWVRGGRSRG